MKKYKLEISDEPHCHDLESIGSIFMPIIKNAVAAEDLIGTEIVLNWKDMVGTEIQKFCMPIKTKYDPRSSIRTLYVETPVGGFALEIQHKERYLLDKINAYFGYTAIHKINVSQNTDMRPLQIPETKEIKERNLSNEEQEFLSGMVGEINDENLREILLKVGKNIILSKKE